MRLTFVLPVEGVLRKVTDGQPIVVMLDMILALREGNTFIYLTDSAAKETEDWLANQGLPHDLVLGKNEDRVAQLRKIRYEWGYPVDVVIEPDPVIVAKCIEAGFTTLGFFHPAYARAEWRPGSKFEVTPWAQVVAAVDDDLAQKRKAEDKKLREVRD